MKFLLKHALAAALVLGPCGAALAAPVTYDFTARISYDTYDSTSAVGQTISGYFVLNPTAGTTTNNLNYTGSNASSATQVFNFFINTPSGLFTSATDTGGFDTITGGGNGISGYTWNAEQGNGANVVVLSLGPLTSSQTPGPLDVGGLLQNAASVIAANADPNYLEVYGTQSNRLLDFEFTSVSPVPLPTALPLLLSGLGLLGFASRRRTAA
jgi:hypothetical protein